MSQNKKAECNQAGLLDAAISMHALKNDAALARMLGVLPPVISKIRHGRIKVSAHIMLKFHELAGMSMETIRSFVGGKP